jgi:two-component system response regulator DesR
MDRKRVLLADDHAATLLSWRALLEPEFEVVESVRDGEALVAAYERLRPDAIVTDIGMPRLNGIFAAERILRQQPDARVVFATVHADVAMLQRALAIGALGYVLKVRVGEDLLPAIRAALQGKKYISPFPTGASATERHGQRVRRFGQ